MTASISLTHGILGGAFSNASKMRFSKILFVSASASSTKDALIETFLGVFFTIYPFWGHCQINIMNYADLVSVLNSDSVYALVFSSKRDAEKHVWLLL